MSSGVALDVTKPEQIKASVKKGVERFGRIDVLVNNAGYGYQSTAEEGDESEIRAQFDVNVFGLFAVTRAVLPFMRAQRSGNIINVSSVAGIIGFPGSGYYAASKHAVEGWSDSLRAELEAGARDRISSARRRCEAPAHLSRWLLMKVLAYRLQCDAFGDIDKSIRRILRSGKEDGVGAPFDRRAPRTREGLGLKAGALLVREWNGRLERIMILEEGFAWNGQTFGSLSQIAKAMTGTNWNGHRFFGLRQGKTAPADAGADRRKSKNRTDVCRANGASAGDASP
jgi:hypothetical protein